MKTWFKDRIFLLLFSSLLLIAVFIIFWLRASWQQEKVNLQENVDVVFNNLVRELEDSLIQMNPTRKITFAEDNQDHILNQEDTSNAVAWYNDRIENESRRVRFLRSRLYSQAEDGFRGAMALYMRMADPETEDYFAGISSYLKKLRNEKLELKLIKRKVNQKMLNSDADIRVIDINAEEYEIPANAIVSKSYYDTFSNSKYIVELTNYNAILFESILRDLLLSLILLLLITTAFIVAYKSLIFQRRLTLFKNELMSNVTHELKTPVATVSVALEALSNFDAFADRQRTEEYLEISKNEINRLNLLIDSVLRNSDGSKQHKITKEKLDLKELVEYVVTTMKLQLEKAGATISLKADPGINFEVEADRIHMTSVLFNLIDNAVKYGKAPVEILIHLWKKADKIVMSVKDNGPGIPKVFHTKIFEKFFRVPSGDHHNVKGHGMGLSYIQSVIKEHGGNIELESNDQKGSNFIISLPV